MCGECGCGGWGRSESHGPGRMTGFGHEWGPHFGASFGPGRLWGYGGPTKAERKEWLENFKKHLQERLSDVDAELASL